MTAAVGAVLTLGETLGSFRSHGRITAGTEFGLAVAGAESNVAIALARLGHPVAWGGRVGDDPVGRLVLTTLRGEGVDVTGAIVDQTAPTATMVVEDRHPLPPSVTYYRAGSAGSRLDADLAARAVAGAQPRVLHLSGITPALSAQAAAAVSVAIDAARQVRGAAVCFDVNYRARLWNRADAARALTPVAVSADIVVASADELPLVAEGSSTEERAAALREAGVSTVVVKHGKRGAESFGPDGHVECPAHPVTEVDSIGAGDAFVGGYLSALLDGLDEAARLRRGAALGALAVTGRGDWERLPSRAELAVFLAGAEEAER
ncbi:sugar kinase [Herbiconiux moechotypicola]|uniref:Sugar kinase n=1 Tax=Herbiconiux moechotypicola TaxID=637393 RepID=A0ABN3DBK7_9MICO|nr:sugar kinase [Herbiconiux moechotypicola]MCS5728820.1 sugar kinase [Herbiconiux moechotypicola]